MRSSWFDAWDEFVDSWDTTLDRVDPSDPAITFEQWAIENDYDPMTREYG